MPKNQSVIDIVPKNELVTDVLPKNQSVVDVKPSTRIDRMGETTQSYQQVISAGQYIGLPFLLTYPTAGTVTMWEGI